MANACETAPTHATIDGYGTNGTGTAGANGGIDYRRRVAENTISILGSLDDQDLVLFGPPPDGLPQNLYMTDFNDPKFGTAQANVFDFNIYHDAALTKEGITAPGDSGGPLIVDQLFSTKVIAAVLSGGDRFFNGEPGSSYGTTSFYQPLYLFWDWIVANNPYKYVSAKTGDGSWFDPNHWVMNLDPNYVTVVNGQLVNALPTTPAQGTPTGSDVNSPKFGNVCFFNDCVNIATGVETVYSSGTGITTDTLSGGPAQVDASVFLNNPDSSSVPDTAVSDQLSAMLASRGFVQPTVTSTAAEGSATVGGEVVQGAPGSSNFVPNDTDGNPATNAPARYYDVTLWNTGTTTLDNGTVIVDRLTINGAQTGLTIGTHGALASLIDTTMYAGNFRVDGQFVSIGDIAVMGGVLSGSGTVTAPYTTAVLGAIAPGTVGTTGVLSVFGNVILSSGSGLLIDASPTTTDRLDVYGQLSVGGTVVFSAVGGLVPHFGQTAVFATGNTITGTFDHVPDTISGVLYPSVSFATVGSGSGSYQEAIVTINASSFSTQLTNATADQLQLGGALDIARGTYYSAMSPIYDGVDMLTGNALGSALEGLVPDNARALPLVSQMITEGFSGLLWQHLGDIGQQGNGGQTAFHIQTGALQLAQDSSVGSYRTRSMIAGLGQLGDGPGSSTMPVSPMEAQKDSVGGVVGLPKGMGGFLSGSSLDGSVAIGGGGGRASVDGFLIAGGFDAPVADGLRVGVSVALAQATATLKSSPAKTSTNSTQGVLYANYDTPGGWFVNGFAGSSAQTMRTQRNVTVGSTTYTLTGHTNGSSPTLGVQIGSYHDVDGISVAPAVGMQYLSTEIDGYSETGGIPAMTIAPYHAEEFDLRVGFDARGSVDAGNFVLKPTLHAFLINGISNGNGSIQSFFTAAPGSLMTFAMAPHGSTWGEIGIGAEADVGGGTTISVRYDANVGRGDLDYGAWSGALRIAF